MIRPTLFLIVLVVLSSGCRRAAEPRPAPAQTAVTPPAAKKSQPTSVADLVEKFKTERKPPAMTTESLLQDYDDGRTVGDRNFKGAYVWMTGPIAKVDTVKGKRVLYLRDDRSKRPIAIRAEFVDDDQPLLKPLKKDDVVTVWGKIRGMPEKNVLLENGILLTDDRRAEIEAALKQ